MIGICCLTSVFLVAWCSSTNSEEALKLMQESTRVSWVEKIEILQQARIMDRSNPEIVNKLAKEAMKQWLYEIATSNYKRLESFDWYIDQGKLGRIEVALAQWDEITASQIVQEYPEWAMTSELLVDIGSVYYDASFLLEASNIYERAITADVSNPKAWTNMGVVQADLWELEMAKQFMDEAAKLDPESTTIQFNRATLLGDLAFVARKDWAETTLYVVEALEILDSILEDKTDTKDVELYKSIVLFENSDIEQSKEILEWLTKKHSDYKDAWYYLWLAYKELGAIDEAKEAFLEVLTLDPSHPRAAQELIELGVD